MQIVRVKIGHYITQKAPLTLRRVEWITQSLVGGTC
jgi:hypothetical protein